MNFVLLTIFGVFFLGGECSRQSCVAPKIVEESYEKCQYLQTNKISRTVHLQNNYTIWSSDDFNEYSFCILESYGFLRGKKFDEDKMRDFNNQHVTHKGIASILNNYDEMCRNEVNKTNSGAFEIAGNFYRCLMNIPNYLEYINGYLCKE